MLLLLWFRHQERISQEREEIEKQRKVLSKRKPPAGASSSTKPSKATKDVDCFLKPTDKL